MSHVAMETEHLAQVLGGKMHRALPLHFHLPSWSRDVAPVLQLDGATVEQQQQQTQCECALQMMFSVDQTALGQKIGLLQKLFAPKKLLKLLNCSSNGLLTNMPLI